jgi:hypothetical protein
MKLRNLLFIFPMIVAVFAEGQTASPDRNSLEGMAIYIAANTLHQDISGLTTIMVDEKGWEKLSKDSDLGPFLKLREPKPGRSMVLVMPLNKMAERVAVYFEGRVASEMVVFAPRPDAVLDASAVKPVPQEAMKAAVPVPSEQSRQDSVTFNLARTATNIAANTLHKNMSGYWAIYIDEKNWARLSHDSDFGPVLKLKKAKAGRSMMLVMPAGDNWAQRVAVYFEGMDAEDMVVVSPDSETGPQPSAVKPVPKEALREIDAEQGLLFTRGEVNSDDDVLVVAYQITSSVKKQ